MGDYIPQVGQCVAKRTTEAIPLKVTGCAVGARPVRVVCECDPTLLGGIRRTRTEGDIPPRSKDVSDTCVLLFQDLNRKRSAEVGCIDRYNLMYIALPQRIVTEEG